jgi:hypothetical protein
LLPGKLPGSQRPQIERNEAVQGLVEAIELGRVQADPAAMIAGWREIGRMLGLRTGAQAGRVLGGLRQATREETTAMVGQCTS